MTQTQTLTKALVAAAGITPKAAAVERPPVSDKLQALMGLPKEQKSTFYQVNPNIGNSTKASPLSPLQGDEIFFMGLQTGARFQSHDGQIWEIENYDWEGAVEVRNAWYPRVGGTVSIQDVRESIYCWTEPFQQIVPAIPAGVDYGIVETRSVD